MARTMLCEGNLPKYFWAKAVNTACDILNRVLIRPILKKTPYELWNERRPNVNYFHVFGCKCFILNNGKSNLGKFDAKSDEGIFLGYFTSSKAYRVFNKRSLTVEESIHVVFDETNPSPSRKEECIDNDAGTLIEGVKEIELEDKSADIEADHVSKEHSDLPKEWRYAHNQPKELIIGDPTLGIKTRSSFRENLDYIAFVSQIEPNCIEEAENDPNWMLAMQ